MIFSSVGSRLALLVFATLLFLALFSAPSGATISYQVSIAHPEQHLFHVTMTIPDAKGEVTVQMPAWNALYQIRDFSGRVQQVEALVGTAPVPVEQLDKQTWRIKAEGTVTVRYAAFWDDAGPFSSQLNTEHAFINPATILMYVPGRRAEEHSLVLSDFPADWRAVSALALVDAELSRSRNTTLVAVSYDALADAPIEAGKFQEIDLPGLSPRVSVAVHGENWNKRKIEEDLAKICQYELKLMRGAPYQHYTFILHIGRSFGGGGMEHANSTAISVPSDEYLDGVAAHEFFHLWNVKRIRPASLEPVDYTKEQYTRALWFAEGVTSTYGSYAMLRSKLWSKQQFYADLGDQITELESRPANKWQSAEQSSLDAWLEKYPVYNRPEYSVSYYTKGQVLGELLDLLIRERTDGARSLDDVMRLLNDEFAKTGKFYNDSIDVRVAAEKIAGGSFEEFFDRYVAHAEPLPYAEALLAAGLELRTAERVHPALGFTADRNDEGHLMVRSVEADSTAAAAGLRVGDVIVLWNKQEPPRRLDRWLHQQKPGGSVQIWVRRDGKQTEIDFRLGELKEVSYQVIESAHPTDKAKRLREGWLRGD